jgi:hypothetical protein
VRFVTEVLLYPLLTGFFRLKEHTAPSFSYEAECLLTVAVSRFVTAKVGLNPHVYVSSVRFCFCLASPCNYYVGWLMSCGRPNMVKVQPAGTGEGCYAAVAGGEYGGSLV